MSNNINIKRAVVILSGGLDSSTCMGVAAAQGYELYPITFDYNQRHKIELAHAKLIAEHYNATARHKIIDLSFLGDLGGSALTDDNFSINQAGVDNSAIPSTYVPARNLIFIAMATAHAELVVAQKIYIGVSAVDYSGYPDCRPEFIKSINRSINLATKLGVESSTGINIETPLLNLNKEETIALGLKLGVPYELTTSCYLGEKLACGICDSCRLRLKGFAANQISDPIEYDAVYA